MARFTLYTCYPVKYQRVSVSGKSTEHSVGISSDHLYETVTSKILLSLKEGWERISEMGFFQRFGSEVKAWYPQAAKIEILFSITDAVSIIQQNIRLITSLVWKPPKGLRCHILISIFFSEGRGKGGDERTQTSLTTRMGTPF